VELTLSGWEIQLSTLLQAATGLTSLTLNMIKYQDFVGGLPSLTALHALPALQELNLTVRPDQMNSGLPYNYQPSDEDVLPSCVLSGLTTLTGLQLNSVLALESLQPFSLLTNLQHLQMKLDLEVEGTADAVQSGQQPFKQLHALTHVAINIPQCKLVSTSSSPTFSGCTGLQELRLHSALVDASAFLGLTGLTKLHLWVATVVEDGAAGVVALLGHVPCMHNLQDLALDNGFPAATVALLDTDAAACQAITASAKLKCFSVSGVRLPRAAWAYLFPAGRRMQQLHKFELCFSGTGSFDCSAFEQLVACCPAIQELTEKNMRLFEQDVSLEPLLRLQHLAQLECPRVVDGDASVGVLASLSSLTKLQLRAWPGLSDLGLLQLTALTGLQGLIVWVPDSKNHRLSAVEVIHPRNPGHAGFRVSTWEGAALEVLIVIAGNCTGTVASSGCMCVKQPVSPSILLVLHPAGQQHGSHCLHISWL
jgi:hypothetical protein